MATLTDCVEKCEAYLSIRLLKCNDFLLKIIEIFLYFHNAAGLTCLTFLQKLFTISPPAMVMDLFDMENYDRLSLFPALITNLTGERSSEELIYTLDLIFTILFIDREASSKTMRPSIGLHLINESPEVDHIFERLLQHPNVQVSNYVHNILKEFSTLFDS